MASSEFDPHVALGISFADGGLARCVRAAAKSRASLVDELKCYQAGIRYLDGIERLPNLLKADLHMNEVQDGSPLSSLQYLEELHLGINLCSDITWIKGMTSLKNVTLFGNEIEDVTPLRRLGGLEVLHLRFNIVDDLGPLGGLLELRELSVSDNLVDDLAPLQRLTKLEMLNVYKNYVSDLSPLEGMRQLRQVYFGQNPLTDVSVLMGLPDLIDVSMDGSGVPPAARAELERHMAVNKQRLGIGR